MPKSNEKQEDSNNYRRHRILYMFGFLFYYMIIGNDMKVFKIYREMLEDFKQNPPKIGAIYVDSRQDKKNPRYILRFDKGHTSTREDIEERSKPFLERIFKCLQFWNSFLIYNWMLFSILGYIMHLKYAIDPANMHKLSHFRLVTIGLWQVFFVSYAYLHIRFKDMHKAKFEDYFEDVWKMVDLLEFQEFSENRTEYNKMRDLISAAEASGARKERGRPL